MPVIWNLSCCPILMPYSSQLPKKRSTILCWATEYHNKKPIREGNHISALFDRPTPRFIEALQTYRMLGLAFWTWLNWVGLGHSCVPWFEKPRKGRHSWDQGVGFKGFFPYNSPFLRTWTSLKTSQDRQFSIFSFQPFWPTASQIVPFINQQSLPALNSHAGQFLFRSGGHFLILQQGFFLLYSPLILDTKKKSCRSTCPGIFRQPCS